jgi:DNA-binding PadR family transcriptional regulator
MNDHMRHPHDRHDERHPEEPRPDETNPELGPAPQAQAGPVHHHHHHDDFWRDWHTEQNRYRQDERHSMRHARHAGHREGDDDLDWATLGVETPSPEELKAWREYFQRTLGAWPEEHWIFSGRRFSPWHQGLGAFNPFVANLLSKGGGLLPVYVLHLVSEQPRFGNEIMEILAARTGGQWVSNPGAIYPLMTLLERQGFIEGKWDDPDKRIRRVYQITPSGKEELERIKSILVPKVEETVKVMQEFLQDLKHEQA